MKQHRKTKIRITSHGIEIVFPIRKKLGMKLLTLLLFVFAVIFGGLGCSLFWNTFILHKGASVLEIIGTTVWWLILLPFGGLFCLTGINAFARKKLILATDTFSIGRYFFGIGKGKHCPITQVRAVNWMPNPVQYERIELGSLSCICEMNSLEICDNIEKVEGDFCVAQLQDILSCYTHSVTTIIFGQIPLSNESSFLTLQNPDVSNMTTPFYHLKRIEIETETYDFHHVEHFLTYSVNYIKKEYLQRQVDVYLYGNPEKLHSNLYQNLKNLYRQVYIHTEPPL